MLDKKPPRAIIETGLYFTTLILNIFLGWVVTKLNTTYLDLVEYGRYSFFIIILFFSRSFFGFGIFESASRLLAVTPDDRERKQIMRTGFLLSGGFSVLFTMFFLLLAVFSDRYFKVKIGDLCWRYAILVGLILIHSYYMLALRGTGQIKVLSLITVLPRIFYLLLLILILIIDRYDLVLSLNMFFLGYAFSLIWITLSIRPDFKNWKTTAIGLWNDLKSYGVHLYLSNIWNELLYYGDKIVISYFLPAQSLAYYYLGYALTFPLSHFSFALATTMFNRFAVQDRISFRVIKYNILYVVSAVLVYIFLRRFIIIYLFSADYLPTVDIMLPLALAFGFSSISKPYALFLMARGEGKTVRNITVFIPTLNIILGLLIIPRYEIIGAGWTLVVVYFCDLLLFLSVYRRFVRRRSS
jgi:O-antigen/teichoic acid export membrane protein